MKPWLTLVGIGEDGYPGLGKAARRELLQGRMARLDIIDTDRKTMTPAQVREAVSDVARIVHALIRAL